MKKSKSYILLLLIIGLMGASLFLMGAVMAGWDVLGWFSTPQAFLIYLVMLMFTLWLLFIWHKMK